MSPSTVPASHPPALSLASPIPDRSDAGDPELLACRHPDPAATSPTASTDSPNQGEDQGMPGDTGDRAEMLGTPPRRGSHAS